MMIKIRRLIAGLFSRIPNDKRVVMLTHFLDDKSLEILPQAGGKTFGVE